MNAFADEAATSGSSCTGSTRSRSGARSSAPREVRADRNAAAAERALAAVGDAARGTANLLPPLRAALAAHCTVGEICGVLREEWGEHDRGTVISVARISVTPVKCFHLDHPDEVMLGADGVVGNRLFFLVGTDGERLRSSETPGRWSCRPPTTRRGRCSTMTFPGAWR